MDESHPQQRMFQKGMTLMEVLVAVMILSMISIAIFTSLRASTSAIGTTDTIAHFEEVKNNVQKRFQDNPDIEDLTTILPAGSIEIDDNTYEVYYDKNFEVVQNMYHADFKVSFQRSVNKAEENGFNIDSSEIVLTTSVFSRGDNGNWQRYEATISSGETGVGILNMGEVSSVPGGGSTNIGGLVVEVVNGMLFYQGQSVGSRYEIANTSPGTMLQEYMEDFSFEPARGVDETTLKYEIKDADKSDEWFIIDDFNVTVGLRTIVRISYDDSKELNLNLKVPAILSSTGELTQGVIDKVPFIEDESELYEASIATLLGASGYEDLFTKEVTTSKGEQIGIDYKKIKWIEQESGELFTFEQIQEGISLYTEQSKDTENPIVDEERFKNKTFVATAAEINTGTDGMGAFHDLHIRIIGFEGHNHIKNGTTNILVPQLEDGTKVTISELTKYMFGEETTLIDFRRIPDVGRVSIIDYRNGFASSTVSDIIGELAGGYLTMDRDRYIEVIYDPDIIEINLVLRRDGYRDIPVDQPLKIRMDFDNEINTYKLTQVLGKDVEGYYEPQYRFHGVYYPENKNRLGTSVTQHDDNRTFYIRYERVLDPLYLNIKVDDAAFGRQVFTDAIVADVSFESEQSFGVDMGTQLVIQEESRTIQTSPRIQTTAKRHEVDFQYSFNNETYRAPGRVSEFADAIKAEYAKDIYGPIVIRLHTEYDYMDIASFAEDNNLSIGVVGSNETLSLDTIKNHFQGQGVTFKPKDGSSTAIEDGKITYFGKNADGGLGNLIGMTGVDFKFQSHAVPKLITSVQVAPYSKNITLLWDVRGMASASQFVAQEGKIGLIPTGNNKYRFSYQQDGKEFMFSDNTVTIPNLEGLEKLTLVIYRNEKDSPNNTYGAWLPLIEADSKSFQRTGLDGSNINHLYNAKTLYESVGLSPGSIPIENVEIIYGTGRAYDANGQDKDPLSNVAHADVVRISEYGGRILSNDSSNIIYKLEDFPSGSCYFNNWVPFTKADGTLDEGNIPGWILGRDRDTAGMMHVPFDYTDLQTSLKANVLLAGGMTFK